MKKPHLRHSDLSLPGITRRKRGRGFAYYSPSGRLICNKQARERLNSLAVPPAWRDVWISPHLNGHIQATGYDERGRKQYIYHPRWTEWRARTKFERVVDFAEELPKLRRAVDHDLKRRVLKQDLVVAATVRILDRTLMRVGNRQYERDNSSYGLTTLRGAHVRLKDGEEIHFRFTGKGGKIFKAGFSDRRVAATLRRLEDLPGQHLFQYFDENGDVRPVTSDTINAYIRDACGGDFSTKDFRTWSATVLSAIALSAAGPAETDSAASKTISGAVRKAARRLGNTTAVCRQSYVHPRIIEGYRDGSLTALDISGAGPTGEVIGVTKLSPVEAAVFGFLRTQKSRSGKRRASSRHSNR